MDIKHLSSEECVSRSNGERTAMPTNETKPRASLLVRFITCILALAAFSLAQASPRIEHWTTDNGARVYFVHAPELPMVDIQFIFDGGSARDGDNKGVALLTSALLDQGAGDLDADAIAARLEDVGAQLSTSSHRDMAVISLRSLTDETLLQPALDIMALILGKPTFPADSIERERKRMLIALQGQSQSPGKIASKTFFKAIYGDHPYAIQPLGSEDSVKALTRDDLIAHYQRYYVARNAVVAVVGALDRGAVEAIVAQLSGMLPEGQAAAPLPNVAALQESKEIDIEFPSSQTHVLMGQPGMRRGDADYFPLYVGNHVLGGSGLVSRISEEVREKRGLAYSAYSYFSPMRQAGPYTLGLQTRNDQKDEALTVLRDTLETFIDQGPTARELKASKQNITGGFPLRISSNGKIANNLAVIGFYKLPLDYLETFNSKVEAVTVEQIRAAFQKRIHPDRMVTVTVGGAPAQASGGGS